MPLYDYICPVCGHADEFLISLADLDQPQPCTCGSTMNRQFPVEAAMGFRPFNSFYCEPLDCDVHGRQEWNQILRSEGIQEKAEPAGKRLEEKSRFASRILPQKPIGRRYADVQRQRDRNEKIGKEIEKRFSPESI